MIDLISKSCKMQLNLGTKLLIKTFTFDKKLRLIDLITMKSRILCSNFIKFRIWSDRLREVKLSLNQNTYLSSAYFLPTVSIK